MPRSRALPYLLLLGVVFTLSELWSAPSNLPRALVEGNVTVNGNGTVNGNVTVKGNVTHLENIESHVLVKNNDIFSKVFAAAVQGLTAAFVASILSAMFEPLINRLLVKRMTVCQALCDMSLVLVARFFLTTFPTTMLKFPVFEVINRAMSFSTLSPSMSGTISGFLFCTLMLPVTNYRFQKSMNPDWQIQPSKLFQAYIPTVTRDIIYGWARGVLGAFFQDIFAPVDFTHKALVFGLTVWASCLISSPCNEWRGYTLQPEHQKLSFAKYFKPVNYVRSTGIGCTIMGVALTIGMLITPYAEERFGYCKENYPIGTKIGGPCILLLVLPRLFR